VTATSFFLIGDFGKIVGEEVGEEPDDDEVGEELVDAEPSDSVMLTGNYYNERKQSKSKQHTNIHK